MHSTQFTRLAQAADENGWTIRAMIELPDEEGTYPSALVVCEREFSLEPGRQFLVSMGVLPDELHYRHSSGGDFEREAFFCDSTYDLTLPTAISRMLSKHSAKVYA